ncbi:Sel1 repeat-containing protein [Aquitalea magnusonii]|uniref:Sel1 repeat-containing protein n=2 Tax=Aquitalea magnusonii TaxID=332411 RepID=A0A318JC07_9NEIS|nr:Sel1 repeat-containing protein [Aquitalea magnusonii]
MEQQFAGSSEPGQNQDLKLAQDPLVQRMFHQTQELVASCTRFLPSDVELQTSRINQQSILINAHYRLTPKVQTKHITGHFSPTEQDQQHAAPEKAAASELPSLLQGASQAAQDILNKPQARYTAVNGNTSLVRGTRFWSLGTCDNCNGNRTIRCIHCDGGTTACSSCHGSAEESCPQCFGACTISCMQCGGLGTITSTEQVSVTHTVYIDGQSHNEYRTEYHNVQRQCPSCSFGRTDCPTCNRHGRVQCRTCHGARRLECQFCNGKGAHACPRCDGSGQYGILAAGNIAVECHSNAELPPDADPLMPLIQQIHPLEMLPQTLDKQALQELKGSSQGSCFQLHARFTGQLEIIRIGIRCAEQDFSLSAFGKQIEWVEQDNLVERLLTGDLTLLEKALLDVDRDTFFKPNRLPVQQALRNALQASLHEQLALDGAGNNSGNQIVSSEFAQRIHARSQTAVHWLAKANARVLWPWLVGAAVVLEAAAAIMGGMAATWLVCFLLVSSGLLIYRFQTLRIFKSTYPSTEAAKKSWSLLWQQKKLLGPICFLVAPAVVLAIAATIWLPAHINPEQAIQTTTKSSGNGITQSVQAWQQGEVIKARALAKDFAQRGDSSVFGFYAWLIAADVGVQAGDAVVNDPDAAQTWIDRAFEVNKNDLWAKTAQATLLLEGREVPRDISKGTELLESAAEGGLVPAMYMAGQYALKGKHVSQSNIIQARKWFERAAAQHDSDSLYALGNLDWYGLGISRPNHKKALQEWKESAALGNKEAEKTVKAGRPIKS